VQGAWIGASWYLWLMFDRWTTPPTLS
jgi:hypothetical protein